MRRWLPVALCLVSMLAAVPAIAQEDEAGLKDHPLLSRMPGYYIQDGQDLDFGAYDFNVGDEKVQRAEGKYRKLDYYLKENAKNPGAIAIARNYRNALVAKGGTMLHQNIDNNGGTMSAKATVNGRTIWVQVEVNNAGEIYTLHIIEEEAMTQQIEMSADVMAAELAKTGKVTLRSIQFDTAKATLKPESSSMLDQVVALLKQDQSLKLEVQGHTDNVGAAAANLKLSQDRAAAVKDYLVTTGGIAAARLTTAGFGDTKPVAPNTTDEGRAQNRRVELVKK
jgi:outer membrane protein OmpA-like peptidoglycan-associated protein